MLREWSHVAEWNRGESPQTVDAAILAKCNELNAAANMFRYPGMHLDRVDSYGLFTFKREWPSRNGLKVTTILECPYVNRSGCQCQVRITEMRGHVLMEVSNAHNEASHEADEAKFLKMPQKLIVVERVKAAPTQTGLQLRRSLLDVSPRKRIEAELKGYAIKCAVAETTWLTYMF